MRNFDIRRKKHVFFVFIFPSFFPPFLIDFIFVARVEERGNDKKASKQKVLFIYLFSFKGKKKSSLVSFLCCINR